MKRLFEIVAERAQKSKELQSLRLEFTKKEKVLMEEIKELQTLENVAQSGLDVIKIQLAESVLGVYGNPYGRTEDSGGTTIADCAIVDIASGCNHLKRQFFGNKRYDGFYQRNDCQYGYGPKHGTTVDYIGLRDRVRDLTDDEKDACIYFLKNYTLIKESKTETK